MSFVKYLLVISVIINLWYLHTYNYTSLFTALQLQNVIPETENDYPIITKQNLRGMGQEVKTTIKASIINTLIKEHWESIYKGVLLASGQDNVSSYTVSLNCYKHVYSCPNSAGDTYIYSNDKQMCQLFGYPIPNKDREIILHMQRQMDLMNHNRLHGRISALNKYTNKFNEIIETTKITGKGLCSGEIDTKTIILYVPQRDLQFEEPTLTNINLAKRRIIQFNLNATEIEDIVEAEIENKILATFPDINIHKTYSECCQKLILSW